MKNPILIRCVCMAKKKLYPSLLIILIMGAIVSFQVGDLPSGPHGGKVKRADNHYVEMKNVYPAFYAFLLGRDYQPLSNKGISCQARFIFADSTSVDLTLVPFSDDGFTSTTAPPAYTFCRLFFNVNGKTISAGFESENLIVQKK